ncbi:uncharacterized protein LOC143150417 [Ptiloglossa arizonensis]|uniref:uncharacterized protein LOC143150417 n=1 Tax=Ptiloglossa arizonensis TaxID=3350558 RepID=UPI003FA0D6C6
MRRGDGSGRGDSGVGCRRRVHVEYPVQHVKARYARDAVLARCIGAYALVWPKPKLPEPETFDRRTTGPGPCARVLLFDNLEVRFVQLRLAFFARFIFPRDAKLNSCKRIRHCSRRLNL